MEANTTLWRWPWERKHTPLLPIGGVCEVAEAEYEDPFANPALPKKWVERIVMDAHKAGFPCAQSNEWPLSIQLECYELGMDGSAYLTHEETKFLIYDGDFWVQEGPWEKHLPLMLQSLERDILLFYQQRWDDAYAEAQRNWQEYEKSNVTIN